MEGLLTQLKLNAYGQNSYDFNKQLEGNPPFRPPVPSFPSSALFTPKMEIGDDKVRALYGVDVESIIIDKNIGLYNLYRRQNKDPFVLERIMEKRAVDKELLINITKKLRDFYKQLDKQYLSQDQKKMRIEQELNKYRSYPAPIVMKADEIAEDLPTDDEIESISSTIDLRGLFEDIDEDMEEGLLSGDVMPIATDEISERALIADTAGGGTSGDALESAIASSESAPIPSAGFRTDASEIRPPPASLASSEDLLERIRFQQALLGEERDPLKRAVIVNNIRSLQALRDMRREGIVPPPEGRPPPPPPTGRGRGRPRRRPSARVAELPPIPFISRRAERTLEEQLLEDAPVGRRPEPEEEED